MKDIGVIDQTFDPTLSTSYFLSIQLSLDGFSFCTLDPIQNRFIQFKHIDFEKRDPHFIKTVELLQNEPHLQLEYKKVFILLRDFHYTLVPNSIYRKEKAAELLHFVFSDILPAKDVVLNNKIKLADARNIFCMQKNLYHEIGEKYPGSQILHYSTPFLEAGLLEDQRTVNIHQPFVHLFFNRQSFHMMVVENRELKLSNLFPFTDNQEMIYFLFFAFEQQKIDIHRCYVSISGEILNNDIQLSLFKSFIKKSHIEKPEKHFNFSPVFKTFEVSRFSNLFNSPLCV